MSIFRLLTVPTICFALVFFTYSAAAQTASVDATAAGQLFSKQCANCHGEGALGGERGPSLAMNPSLRNRSEKQMHDVILKGTDKGMPPFALQRPEIVSLLAFIRAPYGGQVGHPRARTLGEEP